MSEVQDQIREVAVNYHELTEDGIFISVHVRNKGYLYRTVSRLEKGYTDDDPRAGRFRGERVCTIPETLANEFLALERAARQNLIDFSHELEGFGNSRFIFKSSFSEWQSKHDELKAKVTGLKVRIHKVLSEYRGEELANAEITAMRVWTQLMARGTITRGNREEYAKWAGGHEYDHKALKAFLQPGNDGPVFFEKLYRSFEQFYHAIYDHVKASLPQNSDIDRMAIYAAPPIQFVMDIETRERALRMIELEAELASARAELAHQRNEISDAQYQARTLEIQAELQEAQREAELSAMDQWAAQQVIEHVTQAEVDIRTEMQSKQRDIIRGSLDSVLKSIEKSGKAAPGHSKAIKGAIAQIERRGLSDTELLSALESVQVAIETKNDENRVDVKRVVSSLKNVQKIAGVKGLELQRLNNLRTRKVDTISLSEDDE